MFGYRYRVWKIWREIKKRWHNFSENYFIVYWKASRDASIVILTAVLAIISFLQYFEYIKVSKVENRSYLVIERIEPLNIKPREQVAFRLFIRNTGKTPANNVNHRIGIKFGKLFTKFDMDTLRTLPLGYGFKIGADREIPSEISFFTLTDSMYAGIMKNQYFLIAYGRIDYEDEFGDLHYETFAVQYVPRENTFDFINFGFDWDRKQKVY